MVHQIIVRMCGWLEAAVQFLIMPLSRSDCTASCEGGIATRRCACGGTVTTWSAVPGLGIVMPAPCCPAEFFATWCHGCQKSYPEICRIMRSNPDFLKKFKLVKVCESGASPPSVQRRMVNW